MSDTPTPRQTSVMQAIDSARLEERRGPSLSELARALEISVPGVVGHLLALEKKGLATRTGEPYSLALTDSGRRWVRRARRAS